MANGAYGTEPRTVVAVDDEQGDLDVIDAILGDDYHVVCVTSGEDALRALEAHPSAIVLCDQRMPKLTGDEVMARVRILYPDTVRILVTGYSDVEAIVRALNEGQIFAYLQKPFDASTLRGAVERAVTYQTMILENRRLVEENRRMKAMFDRMVSERTTALESENEKLKSLTLTDEMTGIFNVRFLRMRMQEEYERALRDDQPVSLVLADVDLFKAVNDTHGHLAGDAVLKSVAACLRAGVRGADIVARYGGEEFVVVAAGTREAGATILAERLRVAVEAAVVATPEGGSVRVTISLGVASCEGREGPAIEEVLRRSDEAMYQAKKLGRNRTVTWTDVKRVLATKPQSVFLARGRTQDH